jgi:hypothetical protein
MRHSKWLILLCIFATVGLTGCPDDDDDVVSAPTGAALAEAAIEDALDSVIDPLLTLMEFATDFLGGADGASRGIVPSCPDTTGACSSGSLSCTVGTSDLQFDFGSCTITGSSPALTVDGDVDYTPSLPPWGSYTMSAVSVNGSQGLNGLVTLADECNWSWNITADDGTNTSASLILCQFARGASEYPLGESSLFIFGQSSSGFLEVVMSFDGTRTAGAIVYLDESPIAQCNVDLETFDATCSDFDV